MTSSPSRVLIVDDDASHLEIYSLIVKRAGVEPVQVQVHHVGVDLPLEETIGLVLMDYRLNSLKTSAELAEEIKRTYPAAPIVLLTDLWSAPADIEPYVDELVRKDDSDRLLEIIRRLMPAAAR